MVDVLMYLGLLLMCMWNFIAIGRLVIAVQHLEMQMLSFRVELNNEYDK